ncbi:PQQ-binding-like beta-propeller repeat protein [Candidatus Obscuribacterales bacterium]|nr:PQQ-binding-like beta-propeller repeat protein [Candidatus Obscuribacterales bacterium]
MFPLYYVERGIRLKYDEAFILLKRAQSFLLRSLLLSLIISGLTVPLTSCGFVEKLQTANLLWKYTAPQKSIWSAEGAAETPQIQGDRIFYLGGYPWNNQIFLNCIDRATGKKVWSSDDEIKQFKLTDTQVFATARQDLFKREPGRATKVWVRAYDLPTGKLQWNRFVMAGIDGVKVVAVGEYVFCTSDNQLYALDKTNGKEAWVADSGVYPSIAPNLLITDKYIIAELQDRTIGFINRKTGKTEDKLVLNQIRADQARALIIDGDLLMVAGSDGTSTIVNISSQKLIGPVETEWISSKVHIEDSVAYFCNCNGKPAASQQISPQNDIFHFCALDLNTGKYLWKTRVDAVIKAKALILSDKVFVGTAGDGDNFLYTLDRKTGEVEKKVALENTLSGAILANGLIYVNAGSLLAIEPSTGKIVWQFKPQKFKMDSEPVFQNNVIYAVGQDSNLYAFNPVSENKVATK